MKNMWAKNPYKWGNKAIGRNEETQKRRNREKKKLRHEETSANLIYRGQGREDLFKPIHSNRKLAGPFCWIWHFWEWNDHCRFGVFSNVWMKSCPSWPPKRKTTSFFWVLQKAHVTTKEMPPMFKTKNHTDLHMVEGKKNSFLNISRDWWWAALLRIVWIALLSPSVARSNFTTKKPKVTWKKMMV